MKKIIASFFLMSLLWIPLMTFGATGGTGSIVPPKDGRLAGNIGKDTPEITDLDATLNTVDNYVIGVLIVIAVFYIIKAGYTFVTKSDDADAVGKARTSIMYAAGGIVLAMAAKGIISLILSAVK